MVENCSSLGDTDGIVGIYSPEVGEIRMGVLFLSLNGTPAISAYFMSRSMPGLVGNVISLKSVNSGKFFRKFSAAARAFSELPSNMWDAAKQTNLM